MTKSQTIGARLGLALLAAGLMAGATPASAQTGNQAQDTPGDALSRNLRSLSENPKSIVALMGAGKAALDLGDAQAAITFFGRAEEQAPRDGRVKMWLGASLVQLQQAQGALKFFAEAISLGVPEAEVAGARGLAYDLLGDPRRAQRDYRLALQAKPNAQVSRQLALSLAISGEREPALRAIEDQLLIRDRAAERTRAFVLALTGDSAGAARAVQASMPAQSAALTPFLQRLPALSLSDRALAVHLGHFPSAARNLPVPPANSYASLDPDTVTRAGAPDSRQKALGGRSGSSTRTSVRLPVAPERSAKVAPKAEAPVPEKRKTTATPSGLAPAVRIAEQKAPAPAAQSADVALGSGGPIKAPASASAVTHSAVPAPVPQQPATALAANTLQPQPSASPTTSSVPSAAPMTTAQAVLQSAKAPATDVAPASSPGFSLAPSPAPVELAALQPQQQPTSELSSVQQAPAPAVAPVEEKGASRLADIASLIASLPEETKAEAPKPAPAAAPAKKPAATPAKAAEPKKETPGKTQLAAKTPVKTAAAKKEAVAEKKPAAKPAAPAEPKRIWVQVAGGADKSALPREFTRLKTKAPKLLAARSAWTAPLKATNRLLVGPFKTDGEAQAFVNELKKASLTGFAWTSDAGQKIEKLSAK